MKKIVRASTELAEAYNKISSMKAKFGIFHKCVFHMHSPASYDYRLLEKYNDKEYQECNTAEIFNLCIENHVFPENVFTPEYFEDKSQFSAYANAKECLSYLLMAQKIIDSRIEVLVLTDHNTIVGYDKLQCAISKLKKVKKNGVYPELILGIELSCADKNHVVGIFDNTQNSRKKIQEWLDEHILSEKDGTYLTSYDVMQYISKMGGIAYIAHIDTSNTFNDKYLSGAYKKKLFELDCLQIVGISDYHKKEMVEKNIANFVDRDICFIVDEDAHTIDEIGRKCIWIKGSKRNFNMIKDAIRDYGIALDYEEPVEINSYIKGIYIKGNGNNFLNGKEDNDFCLSFSDALNCIIGGRGTGKSSVLQMLDFVIRQHCDNKESLEFICRHEAIWILFMHDNEEYMIRFFAPVKEYQDDPILKYFTDDRRHGYGWKYYFSQFDIEDYALRNYIEINRIEIKNNIVFSERIPDKKKYLEKFFRVRYSVNDLVRTASSEEINSFIYTTLFQNVVIDNASKIVNVRSKNGLKGIVLDIKAVIEKRRTDVSKIIDEFNERQNGLFRIVYSQGGEVDDFDFDTIIHRIHPKGVYYYSKNIEIETVSQYLHYLQEKIGIFQLLICAFDKKYDELNQIAPISEVLVDMTQQMVNQGINEVQASDETTIIEKIMEDLLDNKNISDIIDYLKEYVTEIELFELEFNLNSKEANKKLPPIYKNVRVLSLGQKVVAMLSFVLGYSEYSQDYTPFIIDQPEDNLDNQYIYKNLVKQLRDIKLKRQVIIATHNATIVTNAKAEQVVIMESDNKKGWVEATGYPNEKRIKKHIINYLEGGIESFKHKCFIYDEVLKE